MNVPGWFNAELGRLGRQVLAEDISRQDAATELEDLAFKRENRLFLHGLVHAWMRGRVDGWIKTYLASLTAEEAEAATGALPLPYPELPALLEVRPCVFIHQNAITRAHIKAAIVQAETKATNAAGHAEKVRRLAEIALPLLIDDSMTLASIAHILRAPVTVAAAS